MHISFWIYILCTSLIKQYLMEASPGAELRAHDSCSRFFLCRVYQVYLHSRTTSTDFSWIWTGHNYSHVTLFVLRSFWYMQEVKKEQFLIEFLRLKLVHASPENNLVPAPNSWRSVQDRADNLMKYTPSFAKLILLVFPSEKLLARSSWCLNSCIKAPES